MMIPNYLAKGDSEKQDEVSNLKPSQVKQMGSFIPFVRNGSPNRKSYEKLLERQNSYLSVTTATSASTQPDTVDLVEHQSDHSTIFEVGEEEEDENLTQNFKSSPETPSTISTAQSFLSLDDERQGSAKEEASLDRLDSSANSTDDHVSALPTMDSSANSGSDPTLKKDLASTTDRSVASVHLDGTTDSAKVEVGEAPTSASFKVINGPPATTEQKVPEANGIPVVTDEEAQRMIDEIDRLVVEAEEEEEEKSRVANYGTGWKAAVASITKAVASITKPEARADVPVRATVDTVAITGLNVADVADDDADDIIFAENDDEATPLERPTSEKNIQGIHFSPVSLQNSNIRKTLDIYAIPHSKQDDEEAKLTVAPVITEFKSSSTEGSTACGSSDVPIDKGTESDNPGGADELDPESRVPKKKKMFEQDESRASRVKYLKLVFFACVVVSVAAIAVPFVLEVSASSRDAIATASPSVSMAPSSTPSLSQAPSKAPSSAPSLYPTISNVPTIPPSGHPTVSMNPSMVPSISDAPTLAPSILPTESMEPSEKPSQVPSESPSSNPSKSPSSQPTASMVPSKSPSSNPTTSPSSRPSQTPTISDQPTNRPTPAPTFPTNSFKIRLYWDPAYFWQEEKVERFWCIECVKCAEYGGLDGINHNCTSYGTGDESRCRVGDTLWIRDCRSRGNRFNILGSYKGGFMVRIATTNLCITKIPDDHPHLYIQGCDRRDRYQRFMPWDDYNKFELRSRAARNDCVSQAHHPKSEEMVSLHNCQLAERDETLYWEMY